MWVRFISQKKEEITLPQKQLSRVNKSKHQPRRISGTGRHQEENLQLQQEVGWLRRTENTSGLRNEKRTTGDHQSMETTKISSVEKRCLRNKKNQPNKKSQEKNWFVFIILFLTWFSSLSLL